MSSISLRASCALAGLLTLAACDQKIASPATQYGAHPQLPAPQNYILPPMRIAAAVGWGTNQTPVVPAGLQVHALATGLEHPRMVYTLPNGDVLVVESNG